MSLINRIEKKLIIKNKLFIKNSFPRLPKINNQFKSVFDGEYALDNFNKSGDEIFKDFNQNASVLIKINLNSANKYPASTSLEMLESVIKSLKKRKITKIYIGDCSGLMNFPTRNVMKKKGLFLLAKKLGARVLIFDYGKWVKVSIKGEYFKSIILSSQVNNFDRIINLANLKSHESARFSFSTKSLIGFMHPSQRFELHRDHLEERIAEISLAIKPDISIIDARKIFIDGGPDLGVIATADTIIVDTDLLAADIEAYKLLYGHKKINEIEDISQNYLDNNFFKHYMKINN